MNTFVNKLDKEGQSFNHLQQRYPHISEAKLRAGIFKLPLIR